MNATDLEYIIFVNHLNRKETKLLRELKAKADKWDSLEAEITKIYEGPEDEGDLCDIGEKAAMAFGFL